MNLDSPSQPDDAMRARQVTLSEARELGVVPAGLGKRALAFVIDILLGLMLAAPALYCVYLLWQGSPATWMWPMLLLLIGSVAFFLFLLISTLTHGLKGATAGKAMLGVRSVATRDQQKPGFWRIVMRNWALTLSLGVPLIGPSVVFLSSLWDPARLRRSWLDRLASCWVIDIRKGLDPRDRAAVLAARRERDLSDVSTVEGLVHLSSWHLELGLESVLSTRSHAGVVGFAGALAGWEPQPHAPAASAPVDVQAAREPTPPSPPPPVEAAVENPPARAQLQLMFDDSTRFDVPLRGVIGRAPSPSGEFANVAFFRLEDDERRISKHHLELGLDRQGFWMCDLGSTNGTSVTMPGTAEAQVEAGLRIYLPVGAVVRLGSRTFSVIERPDQEG